MSTERSWRAEHEDILRFIVPLLVLEIEFEAMHLTRTSSPASRAVSGHTKENLIGYASVRIRMAN